MNTEKAKANRVSRQRLQHLEVHAGFAFSVFICVPLLFSSGSHNEKRATLRRPLLSKA
jgi:hypothetical protein